MQDKRIALSQATLIILIGFGAFFFGFVEGRGKVSADSEGVPASIQNAEAEMPENVDFTEFWRAWNILESKYVAPGKEKVSDQDKVWGAIQGLANSLGDPYTVFLPPEDLEMFEGDIAGNFEGVGMEIGIKDGILTVVAPLKDTPAYRAGIKPGDKILQIDGEVTANFTVDQAVRKIRGKGGTQVKLMIVREGKGDPFDVTITRAVIQIPTIDTEIKGGTTASSDSSGGNNGLREDGVFVIRLYNFSANSAELFRGALRKFVESGSDKLIIDLRGNPGGYLEASVDMASWFLPRGKVIVTEDFGDEGEPRVHRSRGYDIFTDKLKLVVLVNGGSASASEILAGALKEHGIATLVGETTFGKGSVQELVPVTDDSSVKVTIARWLTPNGNSISQKGLEPDVVVKISEEDAKNKKDTQLEKAVEILNGK